MASHVARARIRDADEHGRRRPTCRP